MARWRVHLHKNSTLCVFFFGWGAHGHEITCENFNATCWISFCNSRQRNHTLAKVAAVMDWCIFFTRRDAFVNVEPFLRGLSIRNFSSTRVLDFSRTFNICLTFTIVRYSNSRNYNVMRDVYEEEKSRREARRGKKKVRYTDERKISLNAL